MKGYITVLSIAIISLLCSHLAQAQQSDTSSYFPPGLWGIWLNSDEPPFLSPLSPEQWNQEKFLWQGIAAEERPGMPLLWPVAFTSPASRLQMSLVP
jgi:hypothetical protein